MYNRWLDTTAPSDILYPAFCCYFLNVLYWLLTRITGVGCSSAPHTTDTFTDSVDTFTAPPPFSPLCSPPWSVAWWAEDDESGKRFSNQVAGSQEEWASLTHTPQLLWVNPTSCTLGHCHDSCSLAWLITKHSSYVGYYQSGGCRWHLFDLGSLSWQLRSRLGSRSPLLCSGNVDSGAVWGNIPISQVYGWKFGPNFGRGLIWVVSFGLIWAVWWRWWRRRGRCRHSCGHSPPPYTSSRVTLPAWHPEVWLSIESSTESVWNQPI